MKVPCTPCTGFGSVLVTMLLTTWTVSAADSNSGPGKSINAPPSSGPLPAAEQKIFAKPAPAASGQKLGAIIISGQASAQEIRTQEKVVKSLDASDWTKEKLPTEIFTGQASPDEIPEITKPAPSEPNPGNMIKVAPPVIVGGQLPPAEQRSFDKSLEAGAADSIAAKARGPISMGQISPAEAPKIVKPTAGAVLQPVFLKQTGVGVGGTVSAAEEQKFEKPAAGVSNFNGPKRPAIAIVTGQVTPSEQRLFQK